MNHFLHRNLRQGLLTLSAAMLTGILPTRAQTVSDYLFSSNTGTYNQVSASATELTAMYADTYISPALNIGFTFNYEGVDYTQFKMSSNGFISFNMSGTTALTTNNLSTANAASRPIIAPLWDDLDGRATGNVSYAGYELTGSAPNRVLTVEWRNWEWNYNSANPVISFQVKLYETTNVIEFVYRQESGATNSPSASIGIGSATGSGNGSYLNLSGVTTPTASSTSSVTTISAKPNSNQVFTFTPPQGCSTTPVAGTATVSAACNGGPVNLSLSGYTVAQGISIQWQQSVSPGVWNDISGGTTAAYTATYTSSTQYRAKVTCASAPTPAYSNEVTPVNNPAYACYCSPLSGQQLHSNTGNYITNVSIANTPLNNATTAAGTGGYTRNYPTTTTTTASLLQGVNYHATVTLSAATNTGKIWIDYDHSGTFDAGEATTVTNGGITFLNIPTNATPGLTGMRVRAANATPYAAGDACANVSTGYETEDYIVEILANQACTATPATAGTATVDKDTLCLTGNIVLSLSGYPLDLGTEIHWQSSPAGVNNFTDISGATTDIFTITGLNTSMDYRARATCTNPGGGSAFSNVLTVVVNNPTLVSTVSGSRCDAGTVALYARASSGSKVNWYNVPTGGVSLGSGNVFVTPSISATTPYYAAPVSDGGGMATAGLTNAISTTGYTLIAGSFFNALTDFTLDGAFVYPMGTGQGSVVFALQDGSVNPAVTLQSVTVTLTGTGAPYVKTYVPLNFSVPAGNSYKLVMVSRSGNVSGLIRESGTSWGSYPLTVPGILTITSGNCCSANDISTSYYYLYDWQISTGCEGPRTQVDAIISGGAGTTGLASGGTTASGNQSDGTTVSYDASCTDKVAVVSDAAGGNSPGNTTATVLVTPAVQTFNNLPYVPRVCDITPQNNSNATVTIYALQSEFNAYNAWVTANNPSLPLLPTSGSDPNINNIAITQYHGNFSAGNAGPGGMYSGSGSFIPNSSITASTNGTYWMLTFPVTSFSGFFIHAGTLPLPIGLTSISAVNEGSKNRIDWLTANEKDMQDFELQRSADAKQFATIARVNAVGHANAYSYWDAQPLNGVNYYRLKVYNKDGEATISNTVKAFVGAGDAFFFEAYPNPVTSLLAVKVNGLMNSNAKVLITDITGKVIRSVALDSNNSYIDMSNLANGIYLVKYMDDIHRQTIRVLKNK